MPITTFYRGEAIVKGGDYDGAYRGISAYRLSQFVCAILYAFSE